ncbi:hypothetical protein JIN84_20230 [Luteolibacter yonseiensis]|uniref:Uncharacterized protein n=1 Tax=Luteolibacter yonseiensis TaxID=1144680 RepID=A0A934R673_9BACT|nr:hypothetical protein [Luteolibacter yonseiensis]MBK1817961.1 hypothetical protein [Luteolibacter yonseiensis]
MRFRFPLPLDPFRLIAGAFSRWHWVMAGVLIFGILGVFAGIKLTHPTYTISVSLIKRRVPQTVQSSENGQAFRPVDLNDATLLATLHANEPLDLAVIRARNGLVPGMAKEHIETSQLEGTDIFYITYHSPFSPRDALTFSGIWAEEINAYTKRLQQAEALEVRAILQKEVRALEKQIEVATLNLLEYARENNFLGGNSQVAAEFGKLSQIELELENARTLAGSKESQLANLNEQIRHQSPIEYQLKISKDELAALRATYTDANPLVQAKLQSIEYLESQIKLLSESAKGDLGSYTGTPLGNQIYLTIIGLKNELLESKNRVVSLEKLRAATAKRLSEFPSITSGYSALEKKRDAHIEGLSLMSNRLKEAEIFATGAPGYWQVFQAPDPRSILQSSLVKLPLMMGGAGGVFGAGLVVFITLLITHRTPRRSIIECCAATRAPLIASLPTSPEEDAREAVEQFWITHLAPRLHEHDPLLFWTAALNPEDERRLWTLLASEIQKDTGKPARILDLTPDTLWDGNAASADIEWSRLADHPTRESLPNLVRAASLPHGEERVLLSQVRHWIAVVEGQKDSLAVATKQRPITEAYLPPCEGTLAWIERPKGKIRQSGDAVSLLLAKRFS